MSEQKNKVNQVVENVVENLRSIISAEQIVGERIVNDKGQSVIPLSKLSVAIIGGGGEYGNIKISEKLGERFAGGSLTVTSIKPECFIIDNGNGFEISSATSAVDCLISSLNRILQKIKQ